MANLLRMVLATVCVAFVMAAVGHAGDSEPVEPKVEKPADSNPAPDSTVKKSSDPKDLAKANNAFGFKLLKELHADGDNTLISPISLATANYVLALGANGTTLDELNALMGTENIDVPTAFKALMATLPESGKTLKAKGDKDEDKYDREYRQVAPKFSNANCVILDSNRIAPNRSFLDSVATHYGGKAFGIDFGKQESVGVVNDWVAKNTGDQIKSVLSQIHPQDLMYLINAVHFKARWFKQFSTSATEESDFTLDSGKTKKVQMMKRSGSTPYVKYKGHQAAAIEFRRGDRSTCWMWIVLPDKEKGMSHLVKVLAEDGFEKFIEEEKYNPGSLSVPRVKMECETELNATLTDMGAKTAFGEEADYTNLGKANSGAPIVIAKTLHKATLTMDEEGCEAAAVTMRIARGGASAGKPPVPYEMVCDRPFMALIMSQETKSILFAGIVSDPGDK